jgi:hypothetical protein
MPAMIPGGQLSEDGQSVIIRITAGTPETGIWCGKCLLPSGVRIPMYVLTDDGFRHSPYMDFHECTDCGGWI